MGRSFFVHFIIILSVIFQGYELSLAQQIPFNQSLREQLIFLTLNQIQKREEAIRDTMQEAQIRLSEGDFVKKIKEKKFSFKDFTSRMHPYITTETRFDDNFASTNQRKSTLANIIKPGLKWSSVGRGNSLYVDAHIENKDYNNRAKAGAQNIEVDILNNFNIGRYTLSLSDTYFNNYLPAKRTGLDGNDVKLNWKNDFGVTLGRHFNRYGFDLGYSRIDNDYKAENSLANDNVEETINLNQFLRIATKTRLLMEYKYGHIGYSYIEGSSSDYGYNDYNVGITGVLSPKVSGLAKIGYKEVDYKAGDDYRDSSLTGNLGYNISERTNFSLNFKRLIHEASTKAGYYIQNDLVFSGNHRFAFNPKFNLSFGYEADYKYYPKKADPDTESNIYTWNLGLSYAFRRWLDFSLDYSDKKRVSNTDAEYGKRTITFKTQAKF